MHRYIVAYTFRRFVFCTVAQPEISSDLFHNVEFHVSASFAVRHDSCWAWGGSVALGLNLGGISIRRQYHGNAPYPTCSYILILIFYTIAQSDLLHNVEFHVSAIIALLLTILNNKFMYLPCSYQSAMYSRQCSVNFA